MTEPEVTEPEVIAYAGLASASGSATGPAQPDEDEEQADGLG